MLLARGCNTHEEKVAEVHDTFERGSIALAPTNRGFLRHRAQLDRVTSLNEECGVSGMFFGDGASLDWISTTACLGGCQHDGLSR